MPKRNLQTPSKRATDPIIRAAAELYAREREALKVYRPGNPKQDRIHKSPAHRLIVDGGNRCLGGEQEIYDPLLSRCVRVDSIGNVNFCVLACDPQDGKLSIASAGAPFVKAVDDLYRVEFDNGTSLVCTMNHRVVDAAGNWASIKQAYSNHLALASPSDTEAVRQSGVGEQLPRRQSTRQFQRSASPASLGTFWQAHHSQASCTLDALRDGELQHHLLATVSAQGLQTRQSDVQYPQTEFRRDTSDWQVQCRCPCVESEGYGDSRRLTSLGTCLSIPISDGLRLSQTQRDWMDRCLLDFHRRDVRLHAAQEAAQAFAPLQADAGEHSQTCSRSGDPVRTQVRNRLCLQSSHHAILDDVHRAVDHACGPGCRICEATSEQFVTQSLSPVQWSQSSVGFQGTPSEASLDQSEFYASHPSWFNVTNQPVTYITKIEFLRRDKVWDFSVPVYANYWTGVINANSGKSVTSYTEFASRILGIRLKDINGNEIPARFPVPTKEDPQLYWIIGFDLKHIGQTIYRILFEPNLFRVIHNREADRWETFNENNPQHRGREADSVPAEPLIPGRFLDEDSWTWNSAGGGKAANCFESVRFKNGSKLFAYPSSAAQPKQGDPVSGILIDEDLEYPHYAEEYLQRLIDRQGWFMWAAWPHDENYVLSNLIDKCELAAEEGDIRFERIQLVMSENPFFADEKKKLALDTLAAIGEEELIARRDAGERSHVGRKMYDFLPGVHGISGQHYIRALPEYDPNTARGVLQKTYRTLGRFPDQWTRYLAIDPSHTRTAVAFGVVPPPNVNGIKIPPSIIIEDELVLKKVSPEHLAMAVKEKAAGRNYEAFVIDRRFGQQTHAAVGLQSWTVYAQAFAKAGLKSRLTQEYFVPGCDVPLDRAQIVRKLLNGQVTGDPCLWIVLDTTPQMQKEFQKYLKNKVEKGGLETFEDVAAPRDRQRLDVMAALEYLSAYVYQMIVAGRAYVEPANYVEGKSGLEILAATIMGKGGGNKDIEYVHLGPGTAA